MNNRDIESMKEFVADDLRKTLEKSFVGDNPERDRKNLMEEMKRFFEERGPELLHGNGLMIESGSSLRDRKIECEMRSDCQVHGCEEAATWEIPYNKLDTEHDHNGEFWYEEAWLPVCTKHRLGREKVTMLKSEPAVFNALVSYQLPPMEFVYQEFTFPVKEKSE